MKNLKVICFIFSLGMLLVSCKKEIVEIPESNEPVFFVDGTIGGESIHYNIGDEDNSFQNFISTSNGAKYFSGKLITANEEIELGIFGGNIDLTQLQIDSILKKKSLSFAHNTLSPLFELSRENFMNSGNIKEIKWSINDEYAGTNTLKIFEPGKYTICAEILFANKYTTKICNEVIVGYRRSNDFKLEFNLNSDNQLNAWINSVNSPVTNVKWFRNGSQIAEVSQLETMIPEEHTLLTAEITFANGVKRSRSILVDGTQSACSIEDFAAFEQNNTSFRDYKVKLNIKRDGNEYSSMVMDNSDNFIQINSISYYGMDENNVPIYLISGLLHAKVMSKSTNEILDVDMNISWGIGIK